MPPATPSRTAPRPMGARPAGFAPLLALFQLRVVVFFSCALLFAKLFRGEILERSLHYSLLAPLDRAVLVAGKYLGGLIAAFFYKAVWPA